jgi:hypothetical protein
MTREKHRPSSAARFNAGIEDPEQAIITRLEAGHQKHFDRMISRIDRRVGDAGGCMDLLRGFDLLLRRGTDYVS